MVTASVKKLWGTRSHALLLAVAVLALSALAGGSMVAADIISGDGTNATITGTESDDTINGGSGSEVIYGQGGNDVINGNGGNDQVNGGLGEDALDGGAGRDYFNATAEGELLSAQAVGNDTIHARDGALDVVNCGGGNDVAYVDRAEDGVYDCETVIAP